MHHWYGIGKAVQRLFHVNFTAGDEHETRLPAIHWDSVDFSDDPRVRVTLSSATTTALKASSSELRLAATFSSTEKVFLSPVLTTQGALEGSWASGFCPVSLTMEDQDLRKAAHQRIAASLEKSNLPPSSISLPNVHTLATSANTEGVLLPLQDQSVGWLPMQQPALRPIEHSSGFPVMSMGISAGAASWVGTSASDRCHSSTRARTLQQGSSASTMRVPSGSTLETPQLYPGQQLGALPSQPSLFGTQSSSSGDFAAFTTQPQLKADLQDTYLLHRPDAQAHGQQAGMQPVYWAQEQHTSAPFSQPQKVWARAPATKESSFESPPGAAGAAAAGTNALPRMTRFKHLPTPESNRPLSKDGSTSAHSHVSSSGSQAVRTTLDTAASVLVQQHSGSRAARMQRLRPRPVLADVPASFQGLWAPGLPVLPPQQAGGIPRGIPISQEDTDPARAVECATHGAQ